MLLLALLRTPIRRMQETQECVGEIIERRELMDAQERASGGIDKILIPPTHKSLKPTIISDFPGYI